MKKLIRLLMCVGLGVLVVKLVKKLFHSHDEERPTIRVRSGSLDMTANVGSLVEVGNDWRHDHNEREPRKLLVSMRGTDCGSSSFSTNHVDIHCTSSAGSLPAVRIQLLNAGGVRHAFVRHMGQPRSQPGNRRVLMWPDDGSVVIEKVVVPGTTCRVVNTAIAEVIIEQVP